MKSGVAVVVCTHLAQRWDQLCQAVASLRAQLTPPDEVIVVVDGDPALAERISAAGIADLVLLEPVRAGLSVARMRGVWATDMSYVAFLDDDATARPAWLEIMLAHLLDPDVLAVGGASHPVWEGRRPAWFPEEFFWTVGCSYRGMPTTPGAVRNIFGGCCIYRRSQLLDVGGFNPDLGYGPGRMGGGEEAELGMRLTAAFPAGRIIYDPRAIVGHNVPISRCTMRYFASRCWHEGRAKRQIESSAPASDALATEYAFAHGLPRTIMGHLTPGGQTKFSPLRALGLFVGGASAAGGYLVAAVAESGAQSAPATSQSGCDDLRGDDPRGDDPRGDDPRADDPRADDPGDSVMHVDRSAPAVDLAAYKGAADG